MKASDRLIHPPPRSSPSGTIVVGMSVVLLSIIPFLHRMTSLWAIVLALLLVVAAVLFREIHALSLVLFTAALAAAPLLHSSVKGWPYHLLFPLLVPLVLAIFIPKLRESLLWMRIGRLGKDVLCLVIFTAAISGLALHIWHRALAPDLSIHLKYIPDMPIWLFPFAGLGFSAFNAAMEECVFRGVVMQSLDSAFGPDWMPIVIQAWLFGAMHYRAGFPNGGWGLAMAFVYGIMLGVIRRLSQGIMAPWITHVCTDLVVFEILARTISGSDIIQ